MAGYTPSELREMREALRAFQEAYVAYLSSPSPTTKTAAVRAMPEAELALQAGGRCGDDRAGLVVVGPHVVR